MELLKRQKTPTQGTAKTALTPFGCKGSMQGSHFQAKNELSLADQVKRSTLTKNEQALADEAERRDDFCNMHREMIGGNCTHYNVTKEVEPGDRVVALDGCLLWRLIKAGLRIELAGAAEVLPGVTVADVLQRIHHPGDQDRVRKERRLLLICAGCK